MEAKRLKEAHEKQLMDAEKKREMEREKAAKREQEPLDPFNRWLTPFTLSLHSTPCWIGLVILKWVFMCRSGEIKFLSK